jgi:formate hydrogenlyase subunit 6/NADH:ubiquinone oxidoreductase subunit I
MAYTIDQEKCINCWWCRRACPTDTIRYFDQPNRKHWIDPEGCIDCDICAQVCPMHCISHDPLRRPAPENLEAARERARAWARSRRRLQLSLREYAARQVLLATGDAGEDR